MEILTKVLEFLTKVTFAIDLQYICMIYVVSMSPSSSSVSVSGSGVDRLFMILTCGWPYNLFNRVLL